MKFIFGLLFLFGTGWCNNLQVFNDCDRIVGQGIAACVQTFSPIKFVGDVITANKDSLCCTHFRHDACIKAVRDAVRIATASKLCTDSIADDVISTLTDSSLNDFITESCKSFNTQKCIMDSVNSVVNTVKGFFSSAIPGIQQQTPVYRSTIDGLLNQNPRSDVPSVVNPFQESLVPSTEPTISGVINNFRQYIPDASVLNPVRQLINGRKESVGQSGSDSSVGSDGSGDDDSFKSFFDSILNPSESSSKPSDDNVFNADGDNKNPQTFESIGDLLRINRTNDRNSFLKSLTGAIF